MNTLYQLSFLFFATLYLPFLSNGWTDDQLTPVAVTGQSLSVKATALQPALHLIGRATNSPYRYQSEIFGVNAAPYADIMRGTEPFESAVALNPDLVVFVHGETDHHLLDRSQYTEALHQYQHDFAAVLGRDIPIITDQMSSEITDDCTVSHIALAQAQASRDNDLITLVGPKYQYRYKDEVHLLKEGGYEWLYGQHAKVIDLVQRGDTWTPLQPSYIIMHNDMITATFDVPVPPLQRDEVTLAPRENYGFEYADSGDSAVITQVALHDTQITLKLSNQPTGTNPRLRYAYQATCGATHTHWGNIKDSDTTPIYKGYDAANWLIHFDEPIVVH